MNSSVTFIASEKKKKDTQTKIHFVKRENAASGKSYEPSRRKETDSKYYTLFISSHRVGDRCKQQVLSKQLWQKTQLSPITFTALTKYRRNNKCDVFNKWNINFSAWRCCSDTACSMKLTQKPFFIKSERRITFNPLLEKRTFWLFWAFPWQRQHGDFQISSRNLYLYAYCCLKPENRLPETFSHT